MTIMDPSDDFEAGFRAGRKQGIEELRDAILGELAGTWSQTRERVQAIAQRLLEADR